MDRGGGHRAARLDVPHGRQRVLAPIHQGPAGTARAASARQVHQVVCAPRARWAVRGAAGDTDPVRGLAHGRGLPRHGARSADGHRPGCRPRGAVCDSPWPSVSAGSAIATSCSKRSKRPAAAPAAPAVQVDAATAGGGGRRRRRARSRGGRRSSEGGRRSRACLATQGGPSDGNTTGSPARLAATRWRGQPRAARVDVVDWRA